MTEEEISQFNEKGCVSRCIIRHCAIANKPISRDDFVERYRSLFPEGEIGLLSLDRHCFILRDLGLCDGVYSVRNPDAARRAFRAGQTVYVLTDSGSADHLGHKPDHYHCRLAVDMSTHEHDPTSIDEILLYNPKKNGAADQWTPFSLLDQMFVHFLILD